MTSRTLQTVDVKKVWKNVRLFNVSYDFSFIVFLFHLIHHDVCSAYAHFERWLDKGKDKQHNSTVLNGSKKESSRNSVALIFSSIILRVPFFRARPIIECEFASVAQFAQSPTVSSKATPHFSFSFCPLRETKTSQNYRIRASRESFREPLLRNGTRPFLPGLYEVSGWTHKRAGWRNVVLNIN